MTCRSTGPVSNKRCDRQRIVAVIERMNLNGSGGVNVHANVRECQDTIDMDGRLTYRCSGWPSTRSEGPKLHLARNENDLEFDERTIRQ